jgi:hypothetical protein
MPTRLAEIQHEIRYKAVRRRKAQGGFLRPSELPVDEIEDPLQALGRSLREQREKYDREVLNSRPFQDALGYLERITTDFLRALMYVRLHGLRFAAQDEYLLFRFAPHLVESALAVLILAREGLQNAARRELRFLLESSIKLSSRDADAGSKGLNERLAGLDDRSQRLEDYVALLVYFDEFERPEEMNADILSVYSELSHYVHATVPQFRQSMNRSQRGEPAGMESVATLNRFNNLAFQVYDIALARLLHGVGLGIAGDIFTSTLDDGPQWRFHRGKFVSRLSRCFDYKHERRVKRGEIS